MKIRVLHVIDHLGYGGAPFVVKHLVERMPADRIESVVCALRPNPRPIDIDADVITLDCRKYSLAVFGVLKRLSREHRIDIIHAHLQKAILAGLWTARACAARIVIHEHGPIFRGGTGCIYRMALRRLGSRAAGAVANSQAARAALERALARPDLSVVVAGNFVDLERFDPARYDRDQAREALGLAADQCVVGFVGRLDRAKGVDLLIDASAALKEDSGSYCVYLAGDGPERASLEARVRRRGLEGIVVFGGLHTNPAEVMPAFDMAVVPSRREAFGIAALELMRMRVPVIVAPVGGLGELVEHEATGLVLRRLAPEEITGAIRRLRADGALRERLIDGAYERASTFDGREPLRRIVDLYEKLTEGGRASDV